jgi:hypothetical protein
MIDRRPQIEPQRHGKVALQLGPRHIGRIGREIQRGAGEDGADRFAVDGVDLLAWRMLFRPLGFSAT